ncbi:MAG: hypothetical protein M3P94_01595 [Chloroflexota bacterium]|nr:hypothetical protein [Chloroflexota bacterium]
MLSREPAVIISATVAFLTAVIGLGAAFGLDVSDDMRQSIIGVVAPTVGIILLLGPVIRQFVKPVAKADADEATAYNKGLDDATGTVTPAVVPPV